MRNDASLIRDRTFKIGVVCYFSTCARKLSVSIYVLLTSIHKIETTHDFCIDLWLTKENSMFERIRKSGTNLGLYCKPEWWCCLGDQMDRLGQVSLIFVRKDCELRTAYGEDVWCVYYRFGAGDFLLGNLREKESQQEI